MGSRLIKVLIVDDHKLVRQGFQLLLSRAKDIQIVGEARDGVDAVRVADQLEPDVILMDITMPRKDGIQATKEIHEHNPKTAIIIVSMVSDEAMLSHALANGATCFISKNDCYEHLVSAIRDAAGRRGLPA